MELLLEQLQRFAEVLAVSRTRHAGRWGRAAVRRSLRWACYLRHVHRRFRQPGPVRAALEQGLRRGWPRPDGEAAGAAPGPSLEGLGRGDQLLVLALLENAALPSPALHELLLQLRPEAEAPQRAAEAPERPAEDAEDADEAALSGRLARLARRRAAALLLLPLLPPGPARPALRATEAELLLRRLRREPRAGLLDRLWARLPGPRWPAVVAQALLPPPGDPAQALLLAWVLARPPALAALGRLLPAPLLASLLGRHPPLARACLDLLAAWAASLAFHPARGAWLGGGPEPPTWERLRDCFRCFCRAPAPLGPQARALLEAGKARDGGFEVPGLSVWTDLLQDIGGDEPPGPPRSGES
ncbi:Fanconi anemia group F protein [Macrotis lagotis]|uniref:Fanconi anemia group F protein n=1 Tax=Macrotis lagotis TaxID=92651 RepID=UPI003D6870BB